jgi:hypothetical protein
MRIECSVAPGVQQERGTPACGACPGACSRGLGAIARGGCNRSGEISRLFLATYIFSACSVISITQAVHETPVVQEPLRHSACRLRMEATGKLT